LVCRVRAFLTAGEGALPLILGKVTQCFCEKRKKNLISIEIYRKNCMIL
jgi:hypothetical protein